MLCVAMLCVTMVCITFPRVSLAQKESDIRMIVVVNTDNAAASISREQLSSVFLKKPTSWGIDHPVVPIDRERDSKVREVFSKTIHHRPTDAVEKYWQIQIFSGQDVPPAERTSDAAVLAAVRANPKGIGYVKANTPLGANVKVLTVTDL